MQRATETRTAAHLGKRPPSASDRQQRPSPTQRRRRPITIHTVNTTSWPTAQGYLGVPDADVILLQEHKATEEQVVVRLPRRKAGRAPGLRYCLQLLGATGMSRM